MDQAASRRPLTAEAREQNGTGTGVFRVLEFFSVNIIPP
jgi:hypothetical protein